MFIINRRADKPSGKNAISTSICLLACFYIYVLATSISPTGENERGLMSVVLKTVPALSKGKDGLSYRGSTVSHLVRQLREELYPDESHLILGIVLAEFVHRHFQVVSLALAEIFVYVVDMVIVHHILKEVVDI